MDLPSRLSFLFGTEEYVNMRRQLVLLTEKLSYYEDSERRRIVSGSRGEGIEFPPSDEDIMFLLTKVRVVKSIREVCKHGDILMVPSDYCPAYCCLVDILGICSASIVQIYNEIPLLSSTLFKQFYLDDDHIIHGPCVSPRDDPDVYDLALCISGSFWPDVAKDWQVRNRLYGWPSIEMIQNIINGGCSVVAIGDPDSPLQSHEWRISFSVAERKLMHSFNHTQFLTYNLFRLTLKRIINEKFPDVLCSYFMKTALFYAIENTPGDVWHVRNLERCFRVGLFLLYRYIDNMLIPNYFIPEYNMIKRKLNKRKRQEFLDLTRTLLSVGIVEIIHRSGESRCFDKRLSFGHLEYQLDREFFHQIIHYKIFSSIRTLIEMYGSNMSTLSIVLNILEQNVGLIQYQVINIYTLYAFHCFASHMINNLFLLPRNNKQNYHFTKYIESILRIGCMGDLTTGQLKTATYFYLVGKTKFSLCALRKVFSNYPPYVIDTELNELKIKTYRDVMCCKGFSMDYKKRYAVAPPFVLEANLLRTFPIPLRIWISIRGKFHVSPLSYAFFIENLLYIQQQDNSSSKNSTRSMITYNTNYSNDDDIAITRMLVGVIKYVQCDYQSACRWFGSSYKAKDTLHTFFIKMHRDVALTYIACMLNKCISSNNDLV